MDRVRVCLIFAVLAFVPAIRAVEKDAPPKSVKVGLQLLATGDSQVMHEIGAFQAVLPVNRAGSLTRLVEFSNAQAHQRSEVILKVTVTASIDHDKRLHCVVQSDAAPKGGAVDSRVKDFIFDHPGAQVMQLFMDPLTGTHLILSITAAISRTGKEDTQWPDLVFDVKTEQWEGVDHQEIENLQLQSLNGVPVSHDYCKQFPKWAKESAAGQTDVNSIPVLDPKEKKPTVQAGQSFSIMLDSGNKKAKGKNSSSKDEGNAAARKGTKKKPQRILTWEKVYYHINIIPLAMEHRRIRMKVDMEGVIRDPKTHKLLAPFKQDQIREAMWGQAVPFYLTRETPNGPEGYVFWITPRWKEQGGDSGDSGRNPS